MFADALAKPGGGNPRNTLFTSVLTTSGITQAAQGTDEQIGRAAGRAGRVDRHPDSIAYEMYAAMNLANNSQERRRGRCGSRSGSWAPPARPRSYRGQAMMTLARLRSKDHLPAVEKLVGDETVVTTLSTNVNGKLVRHTITVGDMALAAAVTAHRPERPRITASRTGTEGQRGDVGQLHAIPHPRGPKRKEAATKYGWWRLKQGLKAVQSS